MQGMVLLVAAASALCLLAAGGDAASLRSEISQRMHERSGIRYISYGDSTTSGEGVGFEMRYARVMHTDNQDRAREAALQMMMTRGAEALQTPLASDAAAMDDFVRWFDPCGFDPDHVDPEMPVWYGVLNAAMAGYATRPPSWCTAAMTWTNPTTAEGIWTDKPCHRSNLSYPYLLARALDADAFQSESCSGATLAQGIFSEQPSASAAQFGDWPTQTELNPSFERVDPNLVTVGIGANDVRWAGLLKYCLVSSAAKQMYDNMPSFLRRHDVELLITAVLDHFLADGIETGGTWLQGDCVKKNPGVLYERSLTALKTLPERHAGFLRQLQQRHGSSNRVGPLKVLVQNYFSPIPSELPPWGECPDVLTFSQDHLDLFKDFTTVLNAAVKTSVESVQGEVDATIFDVEAAFDGHGLCSSTPYVFGLSIMLKALFKDTIGGGWSAVMHPTADGQAVMAQTALEALTKNRT